MGEQTEKFLVGILVLLSVVLPFILRYFLCPDYCFADYCGFPPRECLVCIYLDSALVFGLVVGAIIGVVAVVGHLCVGTGHGWEKVLEEEEEFLYPTPT